MKSGLFRACCALPETFRQEGKDDEQVDLNELYAKIGQLQMELDFLKKKLS